MAGCAQKKGLTDVSPQKKSFVRCPKHYPYLPLKSTGLDSRPVVQNGFFFRLSQVPC